MNVKQFFVGVVLLGLVIAAAVATPIVTTLFTGLFGFVVGGSKSAGVGFGLNCCCNGVLYLIYAILGIMFILMIIGSFFQGGGVVQQIQIIDGKVVDKKQKGG